MMAMPANYWTGHPLFKLRLPWLTPGAITKLSEIVDPPQSVLEFGAGGSTLFFSDRCQNVVSWENDEDWRNLILDRVHPKGVCVLTGNLHDALTSGPHHIVLVDSNGETTDREAIARQAIYQVMPGGWFIFDNYARYRSDFIPKDWEISRYDDPHWSGKGTLLAHFKA